HLERRTRRGERPGVGRDLHVAAADVGGWIDGDGGANSLIIDRRGARLMDLVGGVEDVYARARYDLGEIHPAHDHGERAASIAERGADGTDERRTGRDDAEAGIRHAAAGSDREREIGVEGGR